MIQNELHLDTQEHVFHFKRLRYIDDIPETLEETYIPVKLLPNLTKASLDPSLFEFIKNNTKLKLESTYKHFELEKPNQEIREYLNLLDTDYAVKSTEYATLNNGTILSCSIIYYSPREFAFSSIITSKLF